MTGYDLTVAICTRDRAALAARALEAVRRQGDPDFDILVVDQSEAEDAELAATAHLDRRVKILRGSGVGVSRARNAAARAADTEWIALVDDDCLLDPDWVGELRATLERYPEADLVSGHVDVGEAPPDYDLPSAAPTVSAERVVRGRRVWPQRIGFTVCVAIRRPAVLELGGWDERLGPGTPDFPAGGEDVDFNYRFLSSGRTAVVTPRMRARHLQWRTPEQIVRLYGGYSTSWAGFAMKHLRTGDRGGGAWLCGIGIRSTARLLASGLRHRSSVRWRAGLAQARGLLIGTMRGLRYKW